MDNNLENRIMQKMNNAKKIAVKKQEYMAMVAEEASIKALEYLSERFELVNGRTKLTKKLQEDLDAFLSTSDEFGFPVSTKAALLIGLEKHNVEDAKNIMNFLKSDAKSDTQKDPGSTPETYHESAGMSKDEIAKQKKQYEVFQKLKKIAETEDSHEDNQETD